MKVSSIEVKPAQEVHGVIVRELISAADGATNYCMRIIEIEPGKSTPAHSHEWEHEVFVLSGRGMVKSEQGETQIMKNSIVFVAPNERHCFVNNDNEPLHFI